MKMIDKFKNWINGFKAIEYDFPLATKADLNQLDLSVMNDTFTEMSKELSGLSCENTLFSLDEFEAEKIYVLRLMKDIIKDQDCINHLKVSYNGVHGEPIDNKEMSIVSTVFSIGLDDRLWKFTFKMSVLYSTWKDIDENKIIDAAMIYLNGWIKTLQLSSMCKFPLHVNNVLDYDNINSNKFVGWVKTFTMNNGNMDCTDNMEDTTHVIQESNIYESNLNRLKDDSMVIDIVRRKGHKRKDINLKELFNPELNQDVTIKNLLEFSKEDYDHELVIPRKVE